MTISLADDRIAATPEPPYYAVIFTSRAGADDRGYAAMAEKMTTLALQQPGCLGVESTRDGEGLGVTVSYWRDEAAIRAWKADVEHMAAQRMGIERWYDAYALRVAKVERHYAGPAGRAGPAAQND